MDIKGLYRGEDMLDFFLLLYNCNTRDLFHFQVFSVFYSFPSNLQSVKLFTDPMISLRQHSNKIPLCECRKTTSVCRVRTNNCLSLDFASVPGTEKEFSRLTAHKL